MVHCAGLIPLRFQGARPGLKAEVFRLQAELPGMNRGPRRFKLGLRRLEGNLRMFEVEERFLEPGKVGPQGEDLGMEHESFLLEWRRPTYPDHA